MTIDGVKLFCRNKYIRLIAPIRKKMITNSNFTIISNNCWGGMVYESFKLQKQTPTVGLFFMADEYIKFLKQFPEILNEKLKFISPYESLYIDFLGKDSRFGKYPVGKLGNVEIEFLHYHNEEEAREKWIRRCKRINFEHIFFKMNDQNLCKERHLQEFARMDFENKLIFSSKAYSIKENIYIKEARKQKYVFASQEPIISTKYIDIIKYINEL